MPELIQDGPNIPVDLMNRRDDGKVVFFCGAGISTGTGLPNFPELVSEIYKRTDQAPLELDKELCKEKKLDKVLGLLEGRLNDGRLRREVINILTAPPAKDSLSAHKALLSLSRHGHDGVRLVTTNFDNRFELADPKIEIDSAPKLPVPKPHGWHSLVHLHGRITEKDADGNDLILTGADFGRAYLTERWASRFITELFREFTIVFVGYSIGDPVMSYMVDALAAERSRGARFQDAYAFAAFDNGNDGKMESELRWKSKNVTPILFSADDDFRKLNETLVKWADISRDPIKSRRQIVFDELRKLPANANDPIVQRVTWALSDKPTAEALAKADPITDEDDFPILSAWVDMFDETGLLLRPAKPHEGENVDQTPVVGNACRNFADSPLDDISAQLAIWLAKHLHVPQILGWAARKGGYLHPSFREQVRRHLSERRGGENEPPKIPERLRLLWTILVQNTPIDHDENLWWVPLIENATSDTERALVGGALIASVRPRLKVLPGPSTHFRLRRLDGDNPEPPTPLYECAHLELWAGEDWRTAQFDRAIFSRDVLANHAFTITGYLQHAVQLLSSDEMIFNATSFDRPAIEEHEQNSAREDWTFLVDWARDAYFALAKRKPPYADLLIRMWTESDIPLLHRLALHALAEDSNSDIRIASSLLLAGNPPNLWSPELHHEVMVFLRKAGQRLPAKDLGQIVDAIKAGPPSTGTDNDDEQCRKQKIRLRLSKLSSSGAKLDDQTQRIADAYQPPSPPDRDEFLSWSGGARWLAPRDLVRPAWRKALPRDELINELREGQVGAEEFEGVYSIWPIVVLQSLRELSDEGCWPATYWQRVLLSENILRHEGKLQPGTAGGLATLLLRAPDRLYTEIGPAIASFVADLSEEYSTKKEHTFRKLWNRAWESVTDQSDVDTDEIVDQAWNSAAGKLATAALKRFWKYRPEAGKGLPEPVSEYFQSIVVSDAGRLGRVMLATQLSFLFEIAPDWTRHKFLPCLQWGTSNEARDLWAAYARAARAGPDLFAAIKADFITALNHYQGLGAYRSKLVHLFLAASNDVSAGITPEEIRAVVTNLPEDGLVGIAAFFEEQLDANETDRANTWENTCFPWLRDYWPKATARNTSATSVALVQCLIKTGDAFPDALAWAREYLRAGTDRVLWRIRESGVHQRWPAETLKMLSIMIPGNSIEDWNKNTLRELLDQMQAADENISQDPEFQRLYRL